MASTKRKGDLAELRVAADLASRGFRVAFPFGEDWDYDLLFVRDEKLERVQVKYTESNGEVILIRCQSSSLTNGKVRAIKRYTAATVDWIAVYDATSNRCYYIPSSKLADGRRELTLRLTPSRNNHERRIKHANDYLAV